MLGPEYYITIIAMTLQPRLSCSPPPCIVKHLHYTANIKA